jgi:5-methylcytosine-specific restriction endonuclease McrA
MSLFRYKVVLADDKEKTSTITAKTVEAARKRVAELNKVKEWVSIKEEKLAAVSAPVIKAPAPSKPMLPAAKATATPKPTSPKTTTKLEKLLFLQSYKCFFCGRVLTKAEASVEHLQPKSGGGNNADGNVVACCVTLNRTFGNISLKEKVRIILDKAGSFTCPK